MSVQEWLLEGIRWFLTGVLQIVRWLIELVSRGLGVFLPPALSDLLAAILLSIGTFALLTLAMRWRVPRDGKPETYAEKVARLTISLAAVSREMDAVLGDLQRVAVERESSVRSLEQALVRLSEDEREARQRIDDLQKVPLDVAVHFARLTEPGERRATRRDWLIFILGACVSAVLSYVTSLVGR